MASLYLLVCCVAAVFSVAVGPSLLDDMPLPPSFLAQPGELLDESTLCYTVGVLSGCSGCVHGTKGQCAFVQTAQPLLGTVLTSENRKRDVTFAQSVSVDPDYDAKSVSYWCLPSRDADIFLERGLAEDAGHLCPVDATDEPIIREPLQLILASPVYLTISGKKREVADLSEYATGLKSEDLTGVPVLTQVTTVATLTTMVRQKSSLLHSSWFRKFHGDVPEDTLWAVDRTSLWGSAGFAQLSGWGPLLEEYNSLSPVDCARLNSPRVLLAGSDVLSGVFSNARSRWCALLYTSAYLSTRCPVYGQAVSGICWSFYERLGANCNREDVRGFPRLILYPTLAGGFVPASPIALFGYPIVSDDTPHCLASVPIVLDGELEHFIESWLPKKGTP